MQTCTYLIFSASEPVTPNNSNIIVNFGKKKLYKERTAKLELSTEATLVILLIRTNVCLSFCIGCH